MQLIVHALAGAALGAQTGHPALAGLAGVVSHALLDELPHRDTKHPAIIAFDVAGTLGVLGWIGLNGGALPAMVGALAGTLPDAEFVLMALHWRRPEQSFVPHHRRGDPPRPRSRLTNLLVQGAVAATSLLVLLAMRERA